jgi:integrase
MSFFRPPILDKATEEKLRKDLTPLWDEGFVGSEIAHILEFGVPDTPYSRLKTSHVYHYRKRFELKERQSHYTKRVEDVTPLSEFKRMLDSIPPFKQNNEHKIAMVRAYIILLYWSGLRKSEIYDRERQDFSVEGFGIVLDALRKKKNVPKRVKMFLPNEFWGIPEVKIWLDRLRENQRPFPLTSTSSWSYVKRMDGRLYPHYFRANRLTTMADDPSTTYTELK